MPIGGDVTAIFRSTIISPISINYPSYQFN